MHGPKWICPSVSQRVELLKLKAKFEAIENQKCRAVIVEYHGDVPDSEFLKLDVLRYDHWTHEDSQYCMRETTRNSGEFVLMRRRFYFDRSNHPDTMELLKKAGCLANTWTAASGIPKFSYESSQEACKWLSVVHDLYSHYWQHNSLGWIPARKVRGVQIDAFAVANDIGACSREVIEVLAGRRWNGREIYRSILEDRLSNTAAPVADRLSLLHSLIQELQQAWPTPLIHGIDSPQLEIDLVWEFLRLCTGEKRPQLPDLRFPANEVIHRRNYGPELNGMIRASWDQYQEALASALEYLDAERQQDSGSGQDIQEDDSGKSDRAKQMQWIRSRYIKIHSEGKGFNESVKPKFNDAVEDGIIEIAGLDATAIKVKKDNFRAYRLHVRDELRPRFATDESKAVD